MSRIFGLFFLIIAGGCGSAVEISKSPAILSAVYDSGTASSSLTFKQDSTFEWFSGSALGAADTYQGKYVLHDSTIYLDKIGFDRIIKSKRLLLTKTHPDPRGVRGDYLVQIDTLNRVVDSIFIFTVSDFRHDTLDHNAHNNSFKK